MGYATTLIGEIPEWDHLYLQLHSSDGLNHQRLGHLDPAHPRTTPELTRQAEEMYLANYKATDYILGMVAELAEQSGAVLAVVADHSAVPTHTWVDVVRPFQERGWIHFDEKTGWWDPTRSKLRNMDNHSFHVNLVGRQPDGIVDPAEYEYLRDQVITTICPTPPIPASAATGRSCCSTGRASVQASASRTPGPSTWRPRWRRSRGSSPLLSQRDTCCTRCSRHASELTHRR